MGLSVGPMARTSNTLTAVGIKSAPAGRLSDGGGLMLEKDDAGKGKWIWRYSFAGRRRDMGLGAYPAVSLAEARRARDQWAALILKGIDPISERERLRLAEREEMDRSDPTLAELIDMAFEARKAGLRGEGERGRWMSPLRKHLIPKLGARRGSTIHQSDVRDALAPIWNRKAPTAWKVIQRLRVVLEWAKLAGYPVDPFVVRAAAHMLGPQRHEVAHIVSTPWQTIPALFAALGAGTSSHLCLRMMILTATRTDSVSGMRFDEIDGDVWTIPAERMKGAQGKVRDFRVPLSPAAMAIVDALRPFRSGLLFPGNTWRPLTSTALEKALNTLGEAGRPHGFRTSFRTWVQDTRSADWDVAEAALAHVVGGRVERSYARSDLLDQRRALMARWAAFVTGAEADNVVQLPHQHLRA